MRRILQPPSLLHDWKTLILLGIAIFFISFCTRLFDYPNWVAGNFRVAGEWIMGTHDAYYWLAGAEGQGPAQQAPPTLFLQLISGITGMSLGNTAFWLPAFMAGFTGVATLLWAWTLGCTEAGVLAGTLTILAPGFLFRTRLGYYDTDMVTLLFPLLIGWSTAAWIRPFSHSHWRIPFLKKKPIADEAPGPQQIPGSIEYVLISLAGLAAGLFSSWHVHIGAFTIVLVLLTLLMIGLQVRPKIRPRLFFGITLFSLGAFCGIPGTLAALALTLALALLRERLSGLFKHSWPLILCTLLLIVLSGAAAKAGFETERFLFTFVKTTAQQAQPEQAPPTARNQKLSYPAIGQSIVEAQSISFEHILERMHPRPWIPVAGLIGFLFLLIAQPLAIFLLPLVLFSFTAQEFGARVTMFGAPAVMLGLAVGTGALGRAAFEKFFSRPATLLALMCVLTLMLGIPSYYLLVRLAPTPVLGNNHAEALRQLGQHSSPDDMVWTWWDWGYPVEYYAKCQSFADGSKHLGQHIFTVGLALSTHSPRLANHFIRFSAQEQYRPWETLNQLGPQGAEHFLADLGNTPQAFAVKQKQYLVVTSENLPLTPWILYYGTWDFLARDGEHANVIRFAPPFAVDYKSGTVTVESRKKSYPLRSIDVLRKDGVKRFRFPDNEDTNHLILCPEQREYYILDALTYESMMIQLLVEPADSPDFAPYFRLAYEKKPDIRIFEVLNAPE